MVGYENRENESSLSESALAGGVSGAITRLVLHPLDVIKTRFQLQVEPISHKYEFSKYQSFPQTVKTIFQEESVSAFWKGHISAQILSVTYGVVQFTAFEQFTKLTVHVKPEWNNSSTIHFACGGVATSLATIFSFPFDVTRTRFIAQGSIKMYKTVPEAMFLIVKKEGFRSLFKGLLPTMVQSAPYGACQFGFYTVFSKLNSKLSLFTESLTGKQLVSGNAVCGFLSGLCAKTVVYPLDLCRKRLQIQGFQEARKEFGKEFVCSGMIDCLARIYKEESFNGLFKGLQPALIKAAFVTSLYFTTYDFTIKFLKKLEF